MAPGLDRTVGDLAGRQHRVVSRHQLKDLGLGDDAIDLRILRGWLRPIYRGVFAVGCEPLDDRGRWMAAVLASGALGVPVVRQSTGDDGRTSSGASVPYQPATTRATVNVGLWNVTSPVLLSHGSAAALHGLLPPRDRAGVDVTTEHSRRSRPGLRLHRSRTLDGVGTWRAGIPCTTVARTLVDIAASGNAVAFERAWSTAASLRQLRGPEIERELDVAPRRPGSRLVRAALATDLGYLRQPSRSGWERAALRLCHDFGLPRPVANRLIRVDGRTFEADLLWAEQRLIVEVDADGTHGHAVARRIDRERDLALQLAGWRTVRIGEFELTAERPALAKRLAAALAQAPLAPASGYCALD